MWDKIFHALYQHFIIKLNHHLLLIHQGLFFCINLIQEIFILFCRYNQRKNDTVNIQFGPLCNYQTTQTNSNLGRIRVGKK
jgi:hypothetical protein